nr:type VI secretion system contractile sheath small subunit [uncultured Rhodopila sp.]
MTDWLLLLAYFALPATITLIAFVGLKLHERNAPPLPDNAGELDTNQAYLGPAGVAAQILELKALLVGRANRLDPGSNVDRSEAMEKLLEQMLRKEDERQKAKRGSISEASSTE